MSTLNEALILTLAMGGVILFCRAFPFLFSAGVQRQSGFFTFVEKTVPPVAMTVLAFNAIGEALRANIFDVFEGIIGYDGLFVLAAAAITVLLHLWKRNALLSIIGGTVLYMLLLRLI